MLLVQGAVSLLFSTLDSSKRKLAMFNRLKDLIEKDSHFSIKPDKDGYMICKIFAYTSDKEDAQYIIKALDLSTKLYFSEYLQRYRIVISGKKRDFLLTLFKGYQGPRSKEINIMRDYLKSSLFSKKKRVELMEQLNQINESKYSYKDAEE